MSELEKFEQGFLDTLSLLGEGLDKIVIVGGWCPYLYAHYLWHRQIPNIPTTTDIDLGVIETGPKRFAHTIYDQLKKAGLGIERLYDQEEEPIEFIYKKKDIEMKLEFITSFETSDDTLNRFLGNKLACNRIEAFELLLTNPLSISVKHSDKQLVLNIPAPETFLFHKGITFVMRSNEVKRDKDLFYVYFILKFCPDRKELLKSLNHFEKHELMETFRQNINDYLSDISKPGYLMLRPFVKRWEEERNINNEIKSIFDTLFQVIG